MLVLLRISFLEWELYIVSDTKHLLVPTAPRARYDYDDIRREQEREDEIYRRRLLQEQQAAAEQVHRTI